MFAFFENLHIDLNVAIEKRKNLNATMNRKTIFVHDIEFRDVAIDENFDDMFFKRSRTISNINIEKNKNFDDVENEKIIDRNDVRNDEKNEIDRNDETNEIKNEITNSTNC